MSLHDICEMTGCLCGGRRLRVRTGGVHTLSFAFEGGDEDLNMVHVVGDARWGHGPCRQQVKEGAEIAGS